jgi:hypothetical protein
MAKEEAKSQTNDSTATARWAAGCSARQQAARAGGVTYKENPSTAGTTRLCNQPHRPGVCTGALRLTGLFPI